MSKRQMRVIDERTIKDDYLVEFMAMDPVPDGWAILVLNGEVLRINEQGTNCFHACARALVSIMVLEDLDYNMGDALVYPDRGALMKDRHSRTIEEVIQGIIESPLFVGDFQALLETKAYEMRHRLE